MKSKHQRRTGGAAANADSAARAAHAARNAVYRQMTPALRREAKRLARIMKAIEALEA